MKLAMIITFFYLLFASTMVNADGWSPSVSVSAGLGGCATSAGGISACDNGFTNQVAVEIEWYESDGFSIYSDRRHTSRLEKEDFDPDVKGPSGAINTWCYLCVRYTF